ncbi:hypothetical protein EMGBS3_06860 [Anaerolineaceae bacterium]|nr:hypothetical protein EMGBS3_06860 [Anaerolineaceae bacterium]GBL37265.1 hypothetical protein EMGBD1_09520 [Anaerolineaceae bacterium]
MSAPAVSSRHPLVALSIQQSFGGSAAQRDVLDRAWLRSGLIQTQTESLLVWFSLY